MEQSNHIVLCITGAAGRISYSIYDKICDGIVFGKNTTLDLILFDIPQCLQILEALVLEINDCSYELLNSIKVATKSDDAFKDVDVVIFLGGFPRKKGMVRSDLIKINSKIFKEQGQSLNKYAKKTCHSLVIANPANTMAAVLAHFATNIPASNFCALTRLDQNRAQYQLAEKLKCSTKNINNMIVWGNHSPTMFPNFEEARCNDQKVTDLIKDENYFQKEFVERVSKRGSEIIAKKGFSSVFPAGKALCDCLHDWYFGTKEGKYVSMAVASPGIYNVPKGIYCSFPVQCKGNFEYEIQDSVKLSEYGKERLKGTVEELVNEKKCALDD